MKTISMKWDVRNCILHSNSESKKHREWIGRDLRRVILETRQNILEGAGAIDSLEALIDFLCLEDER